MKNLVIVFLLAVIAYMYLGKKRVQEAVRQAVPILVQDNTIEHATGEAPVTVQETTISAPGDQTKYYYGETVVPRPAILDNPIYKDKMMMDNRAFQSYTPTQKRRSAFGG